MKAIDTTFLIPFILLLFGCQTTKPSIQYENIAHKIELNRFEKDILKFEEFDSRVRYNKDIILFTGSSSIRFWPNLADDMAPYNVLNRGFGGSTLPEMVHYFARIVAYYQPQLIYLYCGENDIFYEYSVEETISAFDKFISLCEEQLPNTKVVYISMKPSPSRWNLWPQYQQANKIIAQRAMDHKMLEYVDISKPMLKANGKADESIFISDLLHMNAEGYVRWTNIIKPTLEKWAKK